MSLAEINKKLDQLLTGKCPRCHSFGQTEAVKYWINSYHHRFIKWGATDFVSIAPETYKEGLGMEYVVECANCGHRLESRFVPKEKAYLKEEG